MSTVNHTMPNDSVLAAIKAAVAPTPTPPKNAAVVASGAALTGAKAAPDKSNSKAARDAWLAKCREFGEAAGAGDTSKVGWFEDMIERAYRKEIGTDDAEDGYAAFRDARVKRAGIMRAGTGSDKGVRISEAKRIIQMGMLPQINGLKVFNTAIKVIRDNPKIKGEVDDKLLKIARLQCRSPDVALTDKQVAEALQPVEKDDKTLADLLGVVRARIVGIAKEYSYTQNMRDAHKALTAEIEKQGGTTAEINAKAREERRKEKARAKAARKRKV